MCRARGFSIRILVGGMAAVWLLGGLAVAARGDDALPPFRFERDTFAFANETVFDYRGGHPTLRHGSDGKTPPKYTRRCFVMSRAANQFRKFARFDPSLPPPDDATLAAIVRAVTRHPAWRAPLPREQREVIPGYADLRALSAARGLIVQQNIGVGWTTYLRPGNYRMFFFPMNGSWQQAGTHRALDRDLDRGELFVGYLTSFPNLIINHAILVYAHRPARPHAAPDGLDHYLAYDPNHPEGPRELIYDPQQHEFLYQKDWDFVGGKVTVLQVFGYPVQ